MPDFEYLEPGERQAEALDRMIWMANGIVGSQTVFERARERGSRFGPRIAAEIDDFHTDIYDFDQEQTRRIGRNLISIQKSERLARPPAEEYGFSSRGGFRFSVLNVDYINSAGAVVYADRVNFFDNPDNAYVITDTMTYAGYLTIDKPKGIVAVIGELPDAERMRELQKKLSDIQAGRLNRPAPIKRKVRRVNETILRVIESEPDARDQ